MSRIKIGDKVLYKYHPGITFKVMSIHEEKELFTPTRYLILESSNLTMAVPYGSPDVTLAPNNWVSKIKFELDKLSKNKDYIMKTLL